MNITEPIWRTMHAMPEATAIVQGGREITYSGLRRIIDGLIERLGVIGIGPGSSVAVSCVNPGAHLSLALALARMGAVYCPFHDRWPIEQQEELAGRHRITKWLLDEEPRQLVSVLNKEDYVTVTNLFSGVHLVGTKQFVPYEGREDEPWRIAFSSGTTGLPKSIPWTHRSGSLLQTFLRGVYECNAGSRLLVFAGMGIGLSIGHCMLQLSAGGTVILPSAHTSEEFCTLLQTIRCTDVLTSTFFASDLVSYLDGNPAELTKPPPGLRSFTLAGSVVPPALANAVRRRICSSLFVTYGSTETGTIALADSESLDQPAGSAGRLMPWIQAEALDAEGRVLPLGQIGILRFKSPAMASGYVGDVEANNKAFRSGWFYPGDTGFVDERGYLTLCGRSDDVINLQGIKIDPVQIEQVLCSHSVVRDAAVTAVINSSGMRVLAAALILEEGKDAPFESLRRMCVERVGIKAALHRIVVAQELPRTSAGKLDRSALSAQLDHYFQDATAGQYGLTNDDLSE